MRLFSSVALAALLLAGVASAKDQDLVEPTLRIAPGGKASPRVALTFDACMGKTDRRILSTLIDNRVPATIFVTSRWLKRNKDVLAEMQAHPGSRCFVSTRIGAGKRRSRDLRHPIRRS
jgi:peptidoglycan/xylan/chitin deacetylase (PgdA/CDA1 family)